MSEVTLRAHAPSRCHHGVVTVSTRCHHGVSITETMPRHSMRVSGRDLLRMSGEGCTCSGVGYPSQISFRNTYIYKLSSRKFTTKNGLY